MNEIGFRPNLKPGLGPQLHDDINPCTCGAFDGWVPVKDIQLIYPNGNKHNLSENAMMHMTSVVVTQDEEGWFSVICAECGRESSLKSSSMNGAIKIWNEETPLNNKTLPNSNKV
jgi:hypothetical protein